MGIVIHYPPENIAKKKPVLKQTFFIIDCCSILLSSGPLGEHMTAIVT